MTLQFNRPLTTAESKLQRWASETAQLDFARLHGAVCGALVQSPQQLNLSPLRALHLDAPPEIEALAEQVLGELRQLAQQGDGAPDQAAVSGNEALLPRFTSHHEFMEWMAGLGAVMQLKWPEIAELLTAMSAVVKPGQRRKQAQEQEAEHIVRDILFILYMTPQEYLVQLHSTELLKRMEQHYQRAADADWTPNSRREAALNSLNVLFMAHIMNTVVHQLEVGRLLGADPTEDDFLPSSLPIRHLSPKIGPNQPCPCGSGKKYKKCHGAPGAKGLPALGPALGQT